MRGIQWPALVVTFCMVVLLTYGAAASLWPLDARPPTKHQPVTVKQERRAAQPPDVLPGGGQRIFPDNRLVALYGAPNEPLLGRLGQLSPEDAAAEIKSLAAQYQAISSAHILPTWEIIATVASASPTENGDYSRETDGAVLQSWIDVARQNGIYVVLDFQPGRSDFLSQVQQYKALIDQPNVGVALDPEWRLTPDQVPLEQIGSVGIGEVNAVAQWLAAETATRHLPQKLFLLHEFRVSMLPDREQLDTTHPQLAYAIQMDGQGAPSVKLDTWQAIIQAPPPHVVFGWKNFYQKDTPMLNGEQTSQIQPSPAYISYQ